MNVCIFFSITQILREINFEDSRHAKSVILPYLEALNFDFYELLHSLKSEILHFSKFRAPKVAKMAALQILQSKI